MRPCVVYDPSRYLLPGSRNLAKWPLISERLRKAGHLMLPCERVALADAELAHAAPFVRAVAAGNLDEIALRRIGLGQWSPAVLERVLRVTGGTVAAARHIARERSAGSALRAASVLGGGAHHAHWDYGAGFCVFNDVAIAAAVLQPLRVLSLDLDVHQGDGTAALLGPHAVRRVGQGIVTVSLHARSNFPLRKAVSHIDVELDDDTGDDDYLHALDHTLARIDREFGQFDVCLYQGGVDPLESDRLGHLSLSLSGLMVRDRMAFEWCRARNMGVVCTAGGGYFHDEASLEATVTAHVNQTNILADVYRALS